jgi:POLQ-like helicase
MAKEFRFFNNGFSTGPICLFANYYQFFREVLFAFKKGGKFILLHDDRNPAFLRNAENGDPQRGLWPFLLQSIPSEKQADICRITLQDVVKTIEESKRHGDWIGDFKEKYGLK